jgi:hypothetical protein
MESSMVDAGLVVGGSIGMNANAHPVIMVLQTDAASYSLCKWLSLQRWDKVLLANIGYDTTDVILQEWVGCEAAYNFKLFKDLMHSSSACVGGSTWRNNSLSFYVKTLDPFVSTFFGSPGIRLVC